MESSFVPVRCRSSMLNVLLTICTLGPASNVRCTAWKFCMTILLLFASLSVLYASRPHPRIRRRCTSEVSLTTRCASYETDKLCRFLLMTLLFQEGDEDSALDSMQAAVRSALSQLTRSHAQHTKASKQAHTHTPRRTSTCGCACVAAWRSCPEERDRHAELHLMRAMIHQIELDFTGALACLLECALASHLCCFCVRPLGRDNFMGL